MTRIARWEQGRAVVDALIDAERVQRVAPSRELADVMMARARMHLKSANDVVATDPTGAFQMAYDGARKALAAY